MSEAKHTPGPWIPSKGIEGEVERWIVVHGGEKPWHIATVENGQPGDTFDTEAATAHLIAAAPELLEALELCLPLVREEYKSEFGCEYDEGDHEWKAIELARVAIAKAKGESHE